jgi:hypothetical protein
MILTRRINQELFMKSSGSLTVLLLCIVTLFSSPALAGYQAGLAEENEYFLYAPEGLSELEKRPLLVAFSPGANGLGLMGYAGAILSLSLLPK